MLAVLKWVGAPGSLGFLAMCCAIGLACRAAGFVRAGRTWLLGVYVIYVIAGMPVVANRVASALSAPPPSLDSSAMQSADAIIVLHGDNVLGRVRETRRLVDLTAVRVVVVSGGPEFQALVRAGGIPADRIVEETAASTTAEQITAIANLARHLHIQRPLIIASRLQMPRVAALLSRAQLNAMLAPSAIDDEPPISGAWQFVPAYKALRVTRDALYEHAAIRYYRRKGLIDRASGPGGVLGEESLRR